jgi:hypothetical protein
VVSFVKKGKGLHIIELNEIQPAFDFLNTLSPPTNILSVVPMHNIQFQPISTVSLSKKWLPAALPNPRLEERFAYIFKQHSAIDLRSMKITDSDMDIVVSEIIIKRQCSELNLSLNKITYNGISILALTLRTNKVRGIIFSLLFSS